MKEFTYVYDFGNNLIRYFRYITKKSCFPLSDSILFFFTVKRQFSKLACSPQTIISFQGGYFRSEVPCCLPQQGILQNLHVLFSIAN